MYSRESVGPRMGPWGTPALTRYSCEFLVISQKLDISHPEPTEAAYY